LAVAGRGHLIWEVGGMWEGRERGTTADPIKEGEESGRRAVHYREETPIPIL